MRYSKPIFFLALAFSLSSCYHAQITTDKSPSAESIENPWAHSFIYGLVPPKVVETASECPNGLAKVETKQSFLNGLVGALTFGIYTPMHIKVTCAAESSDMSSVPNENIEKVDILAGSSGEEKARAIQKASKKALSSGKAVYINFK